MVLEKKGIDTRKRTYVHNQIPDQYNPSANSAINVPEPEAKEYGIVSLVAQLSAQQKYVVPERKHSPGWNDIVLLIGITTAKS